MNKKEKRNQIINKKNKIVTSLNKCYQRFLKIRGHPNEIALGLSLGLFVGMTPSMGFHTAIAIFFAALFKWNKISAAVGVWITNPLTAPFIYGTTYFIGAKFMGITNSFGQGDSHGFTAIYQMILKAPEIFWALTIGGAVLGLPLAIIGYYFSFSVVQRYQEDIKRRLVESKDKLVHIKEIRKQRKQEKKGGVAHFKVSDDN